MEPIEDLTIKQTRLPSGRSITDDELLRSERALHDLLSRYLKSELESDLRITITQGGDRQEGQFCLHSQLMDVVEKAKLVEAATLLKRHLFSRIMKQLERKAREGDPEAIADLAAIKDL